MQGMERKAFGDNSIRFMLRNMNTTRVRGLMLWGTHPETLIQSMQLGNQELVNEPVPAFIFERADIVTLEEANQLLERGKFNMLRRQSMDGTLYVGCNAQIVTNGPCAGAALLCETVDDESMLEKKVEIKSNEKGQWYGSMSQETLSGDVTTLSVTAETERAVIDAVVAALGGGKVTRY